jgi:sialate O-acetylesterase
MPFYFVQLAGFKAENGNSATGSNWAELREAQAMATALPNTGMAVTIDIGDANDIHPRKKQDVGKRLAAMALKQTYGVDVPAWSPRYKSMQVKGNKVELTFTSVQNGFKDNNAIKGFEVAGADQHFYPAQVTISGSKLIVSASQVTQPVAVRYAWSDDTGYANLYNKEGFPVAPFRTDNWKAKTAGASYFISE